MPDDLTLSDAASLRLHAAGWSVGEAAFSGPASSASARGLPGRERDRGETLVGQPVGANHHTVK
jgi:hypothetical protein